MATTDDKMTLADPRSGIQTIRISTRTHAVLDFATAGFALAFPRFLGASDRFTKVTTALALGKIGYALLTRHELGVVRVIPMKTHLVLDTVAGATLGALPYLLEEEDNKAVSACAIGMGIFDIAAAPLTDTRSLPPRVTGVTTGPTTALPGQMRRTGIVPRGRRLPRANLLDSLKVDLGVLAPTIAMGPIIRRAPAMKTAERTDSVAAAVETLKALRDKYGNGPLMIKIPLRRQAVLLDPGHVRRVLEQSPEPFATASTEKQAALAHFEPKFALISHGLKREERRRLNDEALKADQPVHQSAKQFLSIVDEEAESLLRGVEQHGELRWDAFIEAWYRLVRRVVFGNAARHDTRITDLMTKLRSNANWAFLKSPSTDLRRELHARIRNYLERAEPGTLAEYVANHASTRVSSPENQVPQWLFAFDPAAMATFRALALLATHPDQFHRTTEPAPPEGTEPPPSTAQQTAPAGATASAAAPHRPLLRAAILESLRLWPTTPMILRQATRETEWENGIMPPHTGVLIYAPFFHRDETRVPFAHSFYPDVWLRDDPEVQGQPPRQWPFVPFSGGPGVCPGRNIALLLTSNMLAALIRDHDIRLKDAHRLPPGNLPGTLNHYTLRFAVEPSTH